jgi:hypothetical protein
MEMDTNMESIIQTPDKSISSPFPKLTPKALEKSVTEQSDSDGSPFNYSLKRTSIANFFKHTPKSVSSMQKSVSANDFSKDTRSEPVSPIQSISEQNTSIKSSKKAARDSIAAFFGRLESTPKVKSRASIAPFFKNMDGCDSSDETSFYDTQETNHTQDKFDAQEDSLDLQNEVLQLKDEIAAPIRIIDQKSQLRQGRTSIAPFFRDLADEDESMVLDESQGMFFG